MKYFVLMLGLWGCATADGATDKGPGIVVTLAMAPGDTARYIVTLVPGPASVSSPPATSWNLRLLGADTTKDSTGDYLRALVYHTRHGLIDTISVALPATFTDSVGPLSIAARGANAFGSGKWARTTWWWAKRKGVPPGPPGVNVDTTTLNKLGLVRVVVRPVVVATTLGTPVQLCAIGIMTDSSAGLFAWGKRAGFPAESVRTDTVTACLQRLAAFQLERPA